MHSHTHSYTRIYTNTHIYTHTQSSFMPFQKYIEKLLSIPGAYEDPAGSFSVCCSVLQCVAGCCSMLQSVAVCCSVLQCVVVCCGRAYQEPMKIRQQVFPPSIPPPFPPPFKFLCKRYWSSHEHMMIPQINFSKISIYTWIYSLYIYIFIMCRCM